MGLEWVMGCGESGADHKINTKLSERQCYMFWGRYVPRRTVL